jgi:transketolase
VDRYGASAPEKALAEAYGFTPAKVADRLAGWLAAAAEPRSRG